MQVQALPSPPVARQTFCGSSDVALYQEESTLTKGGKIEKKNTRDKFKKGKTRTNI